MLEQQGHANSAANRVDSYVGARMRLRRIQINMTQVQLAEIVGMTYEQIQRYENGTIRLRAVDLFTVSRVLSTNIAYFYCDIDKIFCDQLARSIHQAV